jgi:predicted small secreted protein
LKKYLNQSNNLKKLFSLIIINCFKLSACNSQNEFSGKDCNKMTIKVSSFAFQEGGMIPEKYTCDGTNFIKGYGRSYY